MLGGLRQTRLALLVAGRRTVLVELARRSRLAAMLGLAAAATSIAFTLNRYGISANGIAWSVVQALLAFVAWFDLLERRIPNAATGPTAVLAVVARVVFERQALAEILLAGAAALVAFLLVALLARGGLGMGDVKLAGV